MTIFMAWSCVCTKLWTLQKITTATVPSAYRWVFYPLQVDVFTCLFPKLFHSCLQSIVFSTIKFTSVCKLGNADYLAQEPRRVLSFLKQQYWLIFCWFLETAILVNILLNKRKKEASWQYWLCKLTMRIPYEHSTMKMDTFKLSDATKLWLSCCYVSW